MNSPSVLDLRSIFGVQIRITHSARTTGGAFVEMNCTAEPGSGTMIHFHPEQEETFEVVDGQLEVLRDRRWTPVPAGESYAVLKGAVHAWRNAAQVPVRFVNVHRPALGFEAHMTTLVVWCARERSGGRAIPGRSSTCRCLRWSTSRTSR